MFKKDTLGFLGCANRVGLFLAILYAICFAWYFIMPAERELHLSFFKMSFFGFEAMDVASFLFGLIQTYVWAYIFVGIGSLVLGCCCCKKK